MISIAMEIEELAHDAEVMCSQGLAIEDAIEYSPNDISAYMPAISGLTTAIHGHKKSLKN